MEKYNDIDFIIQQIDKEITSKNPIEIKASLDKDYSHVVGLAITDGSCPDTAILQAIKIKGKEILPARMDAIHLIASKNVEPNKRFFSLFKPVEVKGDEIVIQYSDSEFDKAYTIKIMVLLTNTPEKLTYVLLD